MSVQFSLLPTKKEDITVLGDLLFHSKLSLSINRLLWKAWPNETVQREQYAATIAGAHNDPNMLDFKTVDEKTGQIIGYICFARNKGTNQPSSGDQIHSPTDTEGSPTATPTKDIPTGVDPEVLAGAVKACDEVEKGMNLAESYGKQMKTKETCRTTPLNSTELIYIVVDQQHRGRGLGSQLLKRAFAEAKAANIPLYVCSEPAAQDFYEKIRLRGGQSR